ncbi:mediator of RNA polymerase II transcription subunit 10-like [Lytechinus pictus]|uniref:Mediator of RNA polymerase II transcription subunit 10 n=1 Tax=Strongylocentrotus purpuratus TaxID=7668 RepID=A0A7M7RBR0_STRPU|nr:mediator of RNA polymerase II transcription subunit 10 [Strongylocentrotus purpuratus]XP_041454216.1 mediator of RNA polymerase II transcription subunit 10-like [Lytechinus variegatus]XP_041454334.1 mediator of RNA polymerase II transcription subunit 10-like [Lytechinus variegatus]XP_780323.1 mediator of RNA polymerase II transcription subunit 10 [Strongylocentrotus purpuratus]|eukprot:XP_011665838.1 PREDICTED: mediator of RNA polymerase II transcription subunit 10 [Strongylocentrotus purpuratus]
MSSSQPDKFEPLVENLERFIEITRQLGLVVSDFQPQGQAPLNQKLHMLVSSLQELDKNKEQVQDVQVPLELIYEYVDQGKNPQLYTKDCMERAVAKNELVKGKIETFRRFKKALVTELGKMFPEEIDRYKTVRGSDT